MIRIRPTLLDQDLEAINAVGVRNGFGAIDPEAYRRFWLGNPFRKEFEGVPNGWVLEDDSAGIVGTFWNGHIMYELDGSPLKAGVAGSWAVDAEHRSSSLLLAMAFMNQKGVDLCLNGSASSVASRLMSTLRFKRIPTEDYSLSYFWIVRRRAFAAAALRKKNFPAADCLALPAALFLWFSDLLSQRSRRGAGQLRRIESFGDDFDTLWQRLRRTPGRLQAVRSSAVLRWRFADSLKGQKVVAIGLYRDNDLQGYVVLRGKNREQLKLRQYEICDLQVADDAPDGLLELLQGAIEVSREDGVDALEWTGWNSAKRRIAQSCHPRCYDYSVWPAFYKEKNPALVPVLAEPRAWDFSPFDAF